MSFTAAKKVREFVIDLSEEEQLGDLIVVPFVHEEVGEKWVNGVAFVKPSVSIEELNEDVNSMQLLDMETVEFTGPKTDTIFANKTAKWKPRMDKYATQQNTIKLKETLSSFAQESKDKKKVLYKVDHPDVRLSNEYFTPRGYRDKHIEFEMVPYTYDSKLANKTYEHCECLLIWRVFCIGSARPKGDAAKAQK